MEADGVHRAGSDEKWEKSDMTASAEYGTQELQFYFPVYENQCHKVWALWVVVVKLKP